MTVPVRDNQAESRYEMPVDGGMAFISYRRADQVVTMLHAEVPSHLAGRGFGSAMVKGALDLARAEGSKVVPRCSFIAAYIDRHNEYHDLRARR